MLAVLLLVGALLTSGTLHDFLLNLSAEVLGSWLTVVVIDGLWKRLEDGASAGLDAMGRRLEEHRTRPMTDAERQAWRVFVDEYHQLVGAESVPDRLRALPTYRRRMHDLSRRGNATLDEFEQAAKDAPWPERQGST